MNKTNRFELYTLIGMVAFLSIGELGAYLHSEPVVFSALFVGITFLVPMWVDVWKKFPTPTQIK